MELKNKTVLVTGGCGLIGSTMIDQLIGDEQVGKVIILDNLYRGTLHNIEQAQASGRVELVKKDIRHAQDIRAHFDGVDLVVHLAAIRITACAAEPRECLEVMINGTYNVVEAAVQAKVPRFVAASTASIYGLADVFPTREDHHPYHNRTWYGAAKIANEGLYRSFHDMHGLPYVALRYFNVYGPRMDVFGKYTEVLIRWLECLDEGQRPKIFGDGSTTVDWIFTEDIARANILAAKSDVVDEVFNVASSQEVSLLQTLQTLLKVTGHADVHPEFVEERKVNPVRRRLADISKARRLLGWEPRVSLEDGLRKLVDWRRQVIAKQQYGDYAGPSK